MGDRVYKIRLLLPSICLHDLSFEENGTPNSVENLVPYLKTQGVSLPDGQRTNLLLQINHCLLCLHEGNTACSPLSISKISILNEVNRDILANSADCGEAAKKSDIKELANVYCCILTGGQKCTYTADVTEKDILCSDPDTALDILKKLAQEDLQTIDSVLQHPFHWSDFKKVYFVCRVADYINEHGLKKASETKKKQILKNYNMGDISSVVTKNGWIEPLRLSGGEVKQIKKNFGDEVPVSVNTIYNIAVKPADKKSDREKSVFELVRFFRNRYMHCHEDGENVHLCFKSYPSGYFNFFSRRFPKFFMYVYNNMEKYVCAKNVIEEFAALEPFNRASPNVQLVSGVSGC